VAGMVMAQVTVTVTVIAIGWRCREGGAEARERAWSARRTVRSGHHAGEMRIGHVMEESSGKK
jgi:hypothetical protein